MDRKLRTKSDDELKTIVADIYGTKLEYRPSDWRETIKIARDILEAREAKRFDANLNR